MTQRMGRSAADERDRVEKVVLDCNESQSDVEAIKSSIVRSIDVIMPMVQDSR